MEKEFEEQIKKILKDVTIISIVPSGRSGSYFIQSILDNHENILNIPFDVCICSIYDEISKFITGKLNLNSFVDYICNKSLIKNFFKETPNIDSEWINSINKVEINGQLTLLYINKNEFIKNLKEIINKIYSLNKLDQKGFFISLHLTFAKTLGKNINNIKYIIDQTHCYKFMKQIYKIDNKTKFIHTIRDPRASYYSYIEHNKSLNLGSEKFLPKYVNNAFAYTFYSLAKIEEYKKSWLKKENYILIKLEELHESFEEIVKKLALWLDIPLQKSLFESTMGGYLWPCQSHTHKRVIIKNDPKSNYPKWKERLTKRQIKNIEFLASKFMDKQGYKKIYWTNEIKILNEYILSIFEQLNQINLFVKDCSMNESLFIRLKHLFAGRLKLSYYIWKYKPYKCLNILDNRLETSL